MDPHYINVFVYIEVVCSLIYLWWIIPSGDLAI